MKTLVDHGFAAGVDDGIALAVGLPGANDGTQILEAPATGLLLLTGLLLYLGAAIVQRQVVNIYACPVGDTCADATRLLLPGGRIVVPYDATAPYLDSRIWRPILNEGAYALRAGMELWGIITAGDNNGVLVIPELIVGREGSRD